MKPPEVDWQRIHDIIEKHKGDKWGLIPLLQEVQEHTGYIPPEAIEPIAEAMNMHPAEVQGVITFYAGFALEPKGKYVLRVCRGTACHTRGSRPLLERVKLQLGLRDTEAEGGNADKVSLTTPDLRFTVRTVACFGQCALAPVVEVDHAKAGKTKTLGLPVKFSVHSAGNFTMWHNTP